MTMLRMRGSPTVNEADRAVADRLDAMIRNGDIGASRDFALSLVRGFWQYGHFTDRQRPHAARLASGTRAAPAAAPAGEALGGEGFARFHVMFGAARSHGLRRPSIRLAAGDLAITLTPAPDNGRNPGSIYVKVDGEYFGKVLAGVLTVAREWSPERAAPVVAKLRELAADPLEAARVYGHATGHCCFCRRHLSDARSVAMGYGPVCAEHYGLDWGTHRAAQHVDVAQADVAAPRRFPRGRTGDMARALARMAPRTAGELQRSAMALRSLGIQPTHSEDGVDE